MRSRYRFRLYRGDGVAAAVHARRGVRGAAPSLPGGLATLVVMSVIAVAIIALEVNEKLVPLFLG